MNVIIIYLLFITYYLLLIIYLLFLFLFHIIGWRHMTISNLRSGNSIISTYMLYDVWQILYHLESIKTLQFKANNMASICLCMESGLFIRLILIHCAKLHVLSKLQICAFDKYWPYVEIRHYIVRITYAMMR